MSKQSEAKASQGYIESALTCAVCKHLQFDMILPKWMVEYNAETAAIKEKGGNAMYRSDYTLEKNALQKNIRCGIGGFKVKKTAACNQLCVKDPK